MDPVFAFVFGLFGNIVSFGVYLAPLPTFYRIFRRKSTEGFQSMPYAVALFSAMLLLYYAFLKSNAFLLITINSVGCVIESFYLILYMIYAPRSAKMYTAKLLILFNVGALGLIVLFTYVFSNGYQRITIVGWICAVSSVCVFAAPLSIIRLVIATKSVEFMPFSLSCSLTLCAVVWFLYGFALNDFYIAAPNILGFLLGSTQMILYFIYKNRKAEMIIPEIRLQEKSNGVELTSAENLKGDDMNKPETTDINGGSDGNKPMEPSELNV